MDAAAASEDESMTLLPTRIGRVKIIGVRLLSLWPAVTASALFLCLIGHQIIKVRALEGGRFVYTIDDTYAHLAIAKNLLQHGMWTFNFADGFESGSSSLLWPVLIAGCFAAFGIHEYISLILNILAAVGLLFYAGAAVRRATGSSWLSLMILCAIVILSPLPAVVSTGMEHSLQILLCVAFVDLAARILMDGSEEVTNQRTPWWLCLAGVLLVLTRYEGLFLVAAAGLLLLCRRRWKLAMILGTVTVMPVVGFGIISVAKGWEFLPNSLLLKGNTNVKMTLDSIVQYLSAGYRSMTSAPHVAMMIGAAVAALVGSLQRRWNVWTYPALVLLITLIAAAQHLQFASLGWFYRYEAYLVALVTFGVGVALGHEQPPAGIRYWFQPGALANVLVLALAALVFGAPLWSRASESYPHIVSASYSIYEQQYQMARFVREFYIGKGVIANDVGAISFFGDGVKLLDTTGLSNIDVFRARKSQRFDHATMLRLSKQHDAEIAIVYDDWAFVFGGIPPEWIQLGRWTTPQNTICVFNTVSFYATSEAQVPKLLRALTKFGQTMPTDILQDGVYRRAEFLSAIGRNGVEGASDRARASNPPALSEAQQHNK